MKYLIASDLHGSLSAAEGILRRFDAERADKLILLGDLYYHGPRNPLPDRYAPMEVASMLNAVADNLNVVGGNCDAEVDETISAFAFLPELRFRVAGRSVLCAHGHRPPDLDGVDRGIDVYLHGHTHVAGIWRERVLRANPGSPALPREGTAACCLILDEGGLTLLTLAGGKVDREAFR